MALKNDEKKEVYLKLVYCGCDDSLKVDNLHYIHKRLNPAQRGEIVILEPEGVHFFDFSPPNIPQIDGCKTVFHLYLCPADNEKKVAKQSTLKEADGIIFVADTDPSAADKNLESMKMLGADLSNLNISLDAIPFVLQYDKKDPSASEDIEGLEASLNVYGAPFINAESSAGKGVLETFTQISKLVLKGQQERSSLPSTGSAAEDRLLAELMRVSNGEERLGLVEEVNESVGEEEVSLSSETVIADQMEGLDDSGEGGLEDSMDQYALDVDDLSAEEEGGLPGGIEMEPGFELGGEEEVPGEELVEGVASEEKPGIVLEGASPEPGIEEVDDLGEIEIPEGIEMEPGFELGGEEKVLDEGFGEEDRGIELEREPEDLSAGEIDELASVEIPNGIEMEPGFELGAEESLDEELSEGELSAFDGEAGIEMEREPEELPAGELDDLASVEIPNGIEMEPGFELGAEESLDEELSEGELSAFDDEAGMELEGEAEDLTVGELDDLASVEIPSGIEMEPGFELGAEESLDEELSGDELSAFDGEAGMKLEGEVEDLTAGELDDLTSVEMPNGIEMEPGFELDSEETDEMLSEIPAHPETGDSEEFIYGEVESEPVVDVPEVMEGEVSFENEMSQDLNMPDTGILADGGEKEEIKGETFVPGDLEDVDDLGVPDDTGIEPDLGLNNGERLRPLQGEPDGLGVQEVEEAGHVEIPDFSDMKSAIMAAGEETVTPEFMETPVESKEKVKKPEPVKMMAAQEIRGPVVTEVLDEIKASIGKPLSQGGGLFSIPLVLGSGEEEKTFNLKVSIVLEEIQSMQEAPHKVIKQSKQTIKKVKTPLTHVEPIEDASFLDEVEEKASAQTRKPPEVKIDIKPEKNISTVPAEKEKKGFFSGLFGRKK